MIHAAAPCPVDTKHAMIEWWGPVIDEYYAASEGGGTIVNTEEWLTKPGTVGKAWPISEIAIFDDDGNRLEANQIGTVYMAMQGRPTSSTTRTRRRPRRTGSATSSPSATSATSTTTASSS